MKKYIFYDLEGMKMCSVEGNYIKLVKEIFLEVGISECDGLGGETLNMKALINVNSVGFVDVVEVEE